MIIEYAWIYRVLIILPIQRFKIRNEYHRTNYKVLLIIYCQLSIYPQEKNITLLIIQ